jgi:hypothetical protein
MPLHPRQKAPTGVEFLPPLPDIADTAPGFRCAGFSRAARRIRA